MRGEILDVCLPSRTVRGRLVKWKPALLHYQTGLVAIRNDLDLDDGLIVLSRGHGHQQPPRRLAFVNPSRAFPAAGEACPELAAQPQIALHSAIQRASRRGAVSADHRSSMSVLKRSSMRMTALPSTARSDPRRVLLAPVR
jgi:hypothetical protein